MRRVAAIVGSACLLLLTTAAILYPQLDWHFRVKPRLSQMLAETGGPLLESRPFVQMEFQHVATCDSLHVHTPVSMSVNGHVLKADGFRMVVSRSFPSVSNREYLETYVSVLSMSQARLNRMDTMAARRGATDLVMGLAIFVETMAMGDKNHSLENCRAIYIENETSIVVMMSSPQMVGGIVVSKGYGGRRDFQLYLDGITQENAEQIAAHLEYAGP